MKLPMTAMSGLKTLDDAVAAPYTGSAPCGPPAPAAPDGTSTPPVGAGCCGAAACGCGCAAAAAAGTVSGNGGTGETGGVAAAGAPVPSFASRAASLAP